MNRRSMLVLTGITLMGFAIAALPSVGFAQSVLPSGLWQLNVAKSKYSPGPPPKSTTVNIQGEGQNRKATLVGINAAGNPFVAVFPDVLDGQPHPVTGNPNFDATADTRVDDHTFNFSRIKAGKVVASGTAAVSQDGKTTTFTTTGTDANGQQFNNITVFEKQ